MLANAGVLPSARSSSGSEQAPACPGSVNRWADQRLELTRNQLQKQRGVYRTSGQDANAIGAAMHWIDSRILEQRLIAERQQIHSTLLASRRCLVEFQP